MAARLTQRTALLRALMAQQRWIDDHGRTRAGYLAAYGEADGPGIYAADRTQLERLQAAYERACERMPRGCR